MLSKFRNYEKYILFPLKKFKFSFAEWSHEDPSFKMHIYKRKREPLHMGYYKKSVKALHERRKLDWLDYFGIYDHRGGCFRYSLFSGCYALMNYYYKYSTISCIKLYDYNSLCLEKILKFLKYKGFYEYMHDDIWLMRLY